MQAGREMQREGLLLPTVSARQGRESRGSVGRDANGRGARSEEEKGLCLQMHLRLADLAERLHALRHAALQIKRLTNRRFGAGSGMHRRVRRRVQLHFVSFAREAEEPGEESCRDMGVRRQERQQSETRGRLLLSLLLLEVTSVRET